MVNFLKGFKSMIPLTIQRVILAVIGLFVLIFELDGNTDDFLVFLRILLPIVLILTAVALLELKGAHLGALLVMLLAIFVGDIQSFIAALGSYDFFFEQFDDITLKMGLSFIVAVYLVLMIISYLFSEKLSFQFNLKALFFPILITIVWIYMCYGFETAVPMVLAAFIAFGFGCVLGGLLLLFAMPVVYFLGILFALVNDNAEFISIFGWLLAISSIYVMFLLVKAIIPEFKQTKKIEEK